MTTKTNTQPSKTAARTITQIALLICAITSTSCLTERNPHYCDETTPCDLPDTPFCDLHGEYEASNGIKNRCIPDPFTTTDGGATADDGGEVSLLDSGLSMDSSDCGLDNSSCAKCNNNKIEVDEDCDGWNLGGKICEDLGYDGGRLACKECKYDETDCYKCGDGKVNEGEQCDNTAFDGQTCETLGFSCGVLACDENCRFDTSFCARDWAAYVPGSVKGIGIDSSNTIHIAGEFSPPALFGTTSLDDTTIYYARMASDGGIISAIGPIGSVGLADLAVSADGRAYIAGPIVWGTTSFGASSVSYAGDCGNDFWVAGINAEGTAFDWATSVGGAKSGCDYVTALAIDNSGGLIVAGAYDGVTAFGKTTFENKGGLIAKINPAEFSPETAGIVWTSTAKGVTTPNASGVAFLSISTDSAGNTYAVGSVWEDVEFSPLAMYPPPLLYGRGPFIAKLNHAGEFLWVALASGTHVGPIDTDRQYVISNDSEGNAYISGTFYQEAQFGDYYLNSTGEESYVAKLNSSGRFVWATKLGDISVTDTAISGNTLFATGRFSGEITLGPKRLTSCGKEDAFVAKISTATGTVTAAVAGGGVGDDAAQRIAVSPTGSVLIAGTQQTESTFGATTLTEAGGFVWDATCLFVE